MKRTIIITFLFSLISSVSTYLLFHSMEGFKTEIKESKIALMQMKQQVNSIENSYKEQVQYWIQKNSYLQSQIEKTDSTMTASRQKEKSLQAKIQQLFSKSKILKDTSEVISNCDSVKDNVSQLISETNIRDSLCDTEISELKTLIQNKDSAIAVCEKSFSLLRQVTDSSFAFQNKLNNELKLADKKIRRGNIKSKFLSAGVMILSAATTILLLKK
jgi:predicted RNase H-like nuclease (RuvC/YqgF family)